MKSKQTFIHSLVMIFLFFTGERAVGGPGDIFGISAKNMGAGNAMGLTQSSAYSAKGNPASLIYAGKENMFSLSYIDNNLNLKNPDANVAALSSGLATDTYKADHAQNLKSASFGVSIPISNSFAFGAAGSMPLNSFLRVYTFTGKEANYLHYTDRQLRPEIYTALGYRLPFGFSIGGGLFYSLKANGTIQMALSDIDSDSRMYLELKPVYIPYGGIRHIYNFGEGKEVIWGAYYRHERSSRSHITVDMTIGPNIGNIPFLAESSLVAFYIPPKAGLGVAIKSIEHFGIYWSCERKYWSRYQPPIINLTGDDLSSIGGVYAQDPIQLKDTWSFMLGGEYKFEKIDLRAGLEYHTSALPKNPPSLAIIDTERLVVNGGVGFLLKRIGSFITHPLSIDLAMGYSILKSMDLTSSGSDIPSAKIGGNIITLATGISFEY